MAKTDWQMGDTVQPEDMNQIGQEINQLREDVDNIEVPPASTSQAGIVQLSNAVDSTSETQAATSRAVKLAYDRADQAFRLGNERKQDLVDALIAIGVTASTNESWDDLITKVSSVIRATGNANAGDVLSGKTFSNAGANGLTGTMPNRGAVSTDLTSQGQQYTIPAGYHNGTGKVTANISNLTAGNIRAGVTVGGVTGTFSQFSNGATAAQILSGRSAAVNGTTVNGSMPNRTGHVTGQGVSISGTTLRIRPQQGYYPGDAANSVQISDLNFVAGNIRKGVTLFGLEGELKAAPITPYLYGIEGIPWVAGAKKGGNYVLTHKGGSYLGIRTENNRTSNAGDLATWVTDHKCDLTDVGYIIVYFHTESEYVGADTRTTVYLCVANDKMGDHNSYVMRESYTEIERYSSYKRNLAISLRVADLTGDYYIRLHKYYNDATSRKLYIYSVVLV